MRCQNCSSIDFIPTVGSIAAVPAVLLALIQLSFIDSMVVLAGYILINVLVGNVIEQDGWAKIGLSAFVVFVSLIFGAGCLDRLACFCQFHLLSWLVRLKRRKNKNGSLCSLVIIKIVKIPIAFKKALNTKTSVNLSLLK